MSIWIFLTLASTGNHFMVNADNIAYVADPPEDEAETGVGAGICFVGDMANVVPVKQSIQEIEDAIRLSEIKQRRRQRA